MKKVLLLVEGQTEETFVRDVLGPYMVPKGFYLTPTLLTTKVAKSGKKFAGGISTYEKVKKDLQRLLNDSSAFAVSTMIDYYGVPVDFPGYSSAKSKEFKTGILALESSFGADINNKKFIPYFMLHEFEAMLFVSPKLTSEVLMDKNSESALTDIKLKFSSPEEINDNPSTAPSKRILNLLPHYKKPFHGPVITNRIGLDSIRKECNHFDAWVKMLESFKGF